MKKKNTIIDGYTWYFVKLLVFFMQKHISKVFTAEIYIFDAT